MLRRQLLLGAALLKAAGGAAAEAVAVGRLLVATSQSRDAELARSVVLLIHLDEQGAMGLIVNRRADVPLSRLLPGASPKAASTPVYFGGPVPIGTRALYRSREKLGNALSVFGDVYLIADLPILQTMAGSTGPGVFRVYAGYTGWSAGQLRGEVERGLWRVLPGDARLVFDPHPESVWARLADDKRRSSAPPAGR
jgi:putative transcriptional regulator